MRPRRALNIIRGLPTRLLIHITAAVSAQIMNDDSTMPRGTQMFPVIPLRLRPETVIPGNLQRREGSIIEIGTIRETAVTLVLSEVVAGTVAEAGIHMEVHRIPIIQILRSHNIPSSPRSRTGLTTVSDHSNTGFRMAHSHITPVIACLYVRLLCQARVGPIAPILSMTLILTLCIPTSHCLLAL
jgi:hypothetical protein